MDLKTLQELIRLFEASSLTELEVEEDGRRMRLQKALPAAYPPLQALPQPAAAAPLHAQAAPEPAAAASAAANDLNGLVTIDSPMVGTFYSAPSPGEPVFVKIGDRIEASATVCIVEAMKLMNEVAAKFACIIERVLVENGQPVEFGQPLFAVRALE